MIRTIGHHTFPSIQMLATKSIAVMAVAGMAYAQALNAGNADSIDVMELLGRSTAFLCVLDSEYSYMSNGSGFLMWNYSSTNGWPAIVITARHVIEGGTYVLVKTPFDSSSAWPDDRGVIVGLDGNCYFHPSPEVDLAAFLLDGYYTSNARLQANLTVLPHSFAIHDSLLRQGDEVGLFCYPSASELTDGFRSPALRHGIVAWLPLGDTDSERFVVDLPTEPGNSGGPVMLLSRYRIEGNGQPVLGFIGVVVERRFERMHRAFTLPDGQQVDMSYDINIDMTLVEPSSRVIELLNLVCSSLDSLHQDGWAPPAKMRGWVEFRSNYSLPVD